MTTPTLREAAQQALEALTPLANATTPAEREALTDEDAQAADAASCDLRAALAEQAAEQAKPNVWTSVVDEALTSYHLDVANESDDYATARGKMENLLAHAGNVGAYHAAEQAEPVALTRERDARRAAQVENAELKERLARARIDLMRELREQGWTPAPARQEPLTEEQITEACRGIFLSDYRSAREYDFAIARAIERAHGITAAPAEGGA